MKKLLLGLLFSTILIASPQGVPVMTYITVGTSSTQILPANLNRGYEIIQNQGAGTCLISFGAPVTSNQGLQILSGQNYEVIEGYVKTAVYMQCAGSYAIAIMETNW